MRTYAQKNLTSR